MAPPQPPRRLPVSDAAVADLAASMRDNLLDAAHNGNLRHLKRLVRVIDDGVGRPRDVLEAARADGGMWALPVAAGNGQIEVCRYLVQGLRVDVDAADDKGRTPLFYAVHNKNAAVVKYLLDRGADPDKADEGGMSPLHSASGLGDCKIIEMLLAKGAYVDPIADDMGAPLLLATKLQQVGAVKILLEHNADPNKPYMIDDYYRMTPLFQAVSVSSVECMKLLVEAGAVITSDCVTAVSIDSTMRNDGSTECLNFLMEACARRDAPNDLLYYETLHSPSVILELLTHLVDEDKHANAWKIEQLKSFGSQAVQRKDYFSAIVFYTKGSHGISQDI